jgi:iron complex outermembrane recepter protein
MNQSNELSRSIRFALLAGLSAAFASPTVFAQEKEAKTASGDDATTLEPVQVTGSRILRPVDSESASPVFVIDREAIEKTGAATIGEFIQETPAVSGAATNPQVNNGGGTGAATVSLRGLGSARTLLLVNGRRFNAGDVNAIPINAVERVEVLKDGASAIYGSDAIGGVVNFILRDDFSGLQFAAQYGISSENDGEQNNYSMISGSSDENSSLVFGFNYNKTEKILARDREFASAPFALSSGEEIILGSSRTPTGRYVVPRSVAATGGANLAACQGTSANVTLTRIAGTPGTSINNFRCFIGTGLNNDTYNFQADGNLVLTPQERYNIFGLGKSKISENVDFYYELMYNNTRAAFEIAPEPFDGRPTSANVPLSGQSVFNPFGVNITDGRLRLSDAGPRRAVTETSNIQLNSGFRGGFDLGDRNWNYDAGIVYGRSLSTSERRGELFSPALRNALGPSFINSAGVPTCGTAAAPIAGCLPVNFFGPATTDAQRAALRALIPTVKQRSLGLLKMVTANINSSSLFTLPAGDVGLAAGFEYRNESSDFQPDFLQVLNADGNCQVTAGCTSAVVGEFSVREFYAEAFVPILADMSFVKSLNATLGYRYSDYFDSFGSTSNYKLGLEYRPIDDLLLRGTYAKVFRAPTINDLFAGQGENAETYDDPCNRYGSAANPRSAIRDIACRNVPTNGTFNQTDTQANTLTGGNQDLGPEDGNVITWGAVYSPSWLEGVSTVLDFWRVDLKKGIGSSNTSDILTSCYLTANPATCALYRRDVTGEVISVDTRTVNLDRIETNGLDFGVKYNMPELDFGSFRFSLDSTYIANFKQTGAVPNSYAGDFREASSGGNGHYGRWRGLGSVSWSMGPWAASWKQRYIHHITETLADGSVDNGDGFPDRRKIGAYTYHDLQGSYNWEQINTRLSLGIDNVTDKQAPRIYSGFNATTDVRTYDTVGRFFYFRADVTF